MHTISLNGEWDLYYAPEKNGCAVEYSPSMKSEWTKILGTVPGNTQLDLVRAGMLEDPFYGENLHSFRPYEFTQWLYVRQFTVPSAWREDPLILRLDGIDTVADIYVNDCLVGCAANMFVEHTFDISAFVPF